MIPTPLNGLIERLHKAWTERALALKAASFAAIGLINTGIDFAVFWTEVQYWGWKLVPANMLSWLVAMSFSYVMNSFITFGPESGRTLRWRDYLTFAASGVAGMIASTAALVALAYVTPLLLAKLISILVSFAVNFTLSHLVVFRAKKPSGQADERP
jgi:putative flippase GtrA